MKLISKTLLILGFLLIIGVLFFTRSQNIEGATINAASCSQADVQAAISLSNYGDAIIVPAGSCTWNSTLTITKGINLIGAGIGNTIISGNNRGAGNYLISYLPASNNQVFRVSGFTFNITNQQAIRLFTNSEPTTQTNIRIDHNRFTNSIVSRSAIMNWGTFGVIDNNIFDNLEYPLGIGQSGTNDGQDAWVGYSDDFWGTANNMYVEDNTFTNISLGVITDCDIGGRYAVRYNTINTGTNSWPLFDTHEWSSSSYACMGAEIYGNSVANPEFLLTSQGAGRDTAHHNLMPDGLIKLYSDGDGGCSPTYAVRQKMNNNYFFLNRRTLTGTLMPDYVSKNVCGHVVKNSAYWMDNSAGIYPNTLENITTGIGCGPLVNRPTSCTTGVGYWATTQSCTNLTGMVGANPSTPISGTLYKCTATDTWTAYYTPYTYPHPLTLSGGGGGSDTENPSTPSSFSASAISPSQINLSWTASIDNIGVSGYRIYRCTGSSCIPTAQIATSTTNSYSDTSLIANTIYTYAVSAYDAAGNVSNQSTAVQAATLAISSFYEVELCMLVSPMQIASDFAASGGQICANYGYRYRNRNL